MKKDQKKTNILRFFPFTKGLRHHFIIALLGTVVSVFANYMTPQVIRVTVDSVINDEPFNLPAFLTTWIESLGGREFLQHNIILCALVSVGFALISHCTMYVSRVNMAKGCEGSAKNIRDKLFSHIQRLPYAWHNLNQTGDIIQRCTQDVELIRNFISGQMSELLRVFFLIVTPLVLMFSMNAQLACVALCFIPVVVTYSLVFFRIVGKKFQAADEAEGVLTAIVQENLTGVRVVRAFGRERYEKDKFNKQNDLFSDMWVKLGYVMGTNWGLGDLLSGIQVITIMATGIVFVVNGNLTQGEYLAFISYNSMLVWPTRSLGRLLGELSKTTVSSRRLFEILDAESEHDGDALTEVPMNQDIEFKNVNFSYGTSGEVLHDINFKIKAGT
ncbi:MAG: ABC transporter ATP-binding protein, partial [Clostridia bacterium]|nr:ABC transporter ATP-binding protein [Clostridia bacterium]